MRAGAVILASAWIVIADPFQDAQPGSDIDFDGMCTDGNSLSPLQEATCCIT